MSKYDGMTPAQASYLEATGNNLDPMDNVAIEAFGRIANAAIEASGLVVINDGLKEKILDALVERDKLSVSAARTDNDLSDIFVKLYASILGGMSASELWSAHVADGKHNETVRAELVNAAFETAVMAIGRIYREPAK